jgi:hypothetical protein
MLGAVELSTIGREVAMMGTLTFPHILTTLIA